MTHAAAALPASVFARVGRFPRLARSGAAARLVRELGRSRRARTSAFCLTLRDASSPATPRTSGASPRRTAARATTPGAARRADPTGRRHGGAVRRRRLADARRPTSRCRRCARCSARFGDRIYGRYGFADAFHPTDGWVNPDVIGIDLGITLLSAPRTCAPAACGAGSWPTPRFRTRCGRRDSSQRPAKASEVLSKRGRYELVAAADAKADRAARRR